MAMIPSRKCPELTPVNDPHRGDRDGVRLLSGGGLDLAEWRGSRNYKKCTKAGQIFCLRLVVGNLRL